MSRTRDCRSVCRPPRLLRVRTESRTASSGPWRGSSSRCGGATRMSLSVAKRRAEFSTGRWCAREALREMGVEPSAILTGTLREPLWPAGVTGSITHAAGIGAAIALPASLCRGVGIDIVNEQEAKALLPPPELPLTFSAKESAIKALSSTAGRFIDLAEIRLTFDEPPRFEAAFGGVVVQGRWQQAAGFLVTAARF